ncbi:hypothetical protein ACFPJ1_40630 [Kribbella qitaiheensis]|uniref:hypothetical protein n=1 Tax=Kribbella qitaiheensis TaxID=1544730 RepID=UPI00360ADF1C
MSEVIEPTFGRRNDFQPDNPRHVPAALAAAYLAYVAMPFASDPKTVVTVDLIRSWAHRGYVRRVGTHPVTRHALYDLEDIMRRAHDRGLLASESSAV